MGDFVVVVSHYPTNSTACTLQEVQSLREPSFSSACALQEVQSLRESSFSSACALQEVQSLRESSFSSACALQEVQSLRESSSRPVLVQPAHYRKFKIKRVQFYFQIIFTLL